MPTKASQADTVTIGAATNLTPAERGRDPGPVGREGVAWQRCQKPSAGKPHRAQSRVRDFGEYIVEDTALCRQS